MKILKIISIITFVLTLTKFTTGYAANKSFKPYLCAMYPAFEMYKDDCNGSNSWYKIYFPDIYNSKEICMRESDKLFNHHIILQIFLTIKNLEMKLNRGSQDAIIIGIINLEQK